MMEYVRSEWSEAGTYGEPLRKWRNGAALMRCSFSFYVGSYKVLIKDTRNTIFANVNESYAKAIYHIGL